MTIVAFLSGGTIRAIHFSPTSGPRTETRKALHWRSAIVFQDARAEIVID